MSEADDHRQRIGGAGPALPSTGLGEPKLTGMSESTPTTALTDTPAPTTLSLQQRYDAAIAATKLWQPPGTKITIGSIDVETLTVTAQYHPKEIQVDRSIPWQQQINPDVNKLVFEFSAEEGRALNLDLLFDGYEENQSVQSEIDKLEAMSRANIETKGPRYMVKRNSEGGVMPKVDRFPDALVLDKDDPNNMKDAKNRELRDGMDDERAQKERRGQTYKRPHWCFLQWGNWMPGPLDCVIENISTKYLMFGEDGTPLRALVSLRLREAHGVTMATSEDVKTQAERARILAQTGKTANEGATQLNPAHTSQPK